MQACAFDAQVNGIPRIVRVVPQLRPARHDHAPRAARFREILQIIGRGALKIRDVGASAPENRPVDLELLPIPARGVIDAYPESGEFLSHSDFSLLLRKAVVDLELLLRARIFGRPFLSAAPGRRAASCSDSRRISYRKSRSYRRQSDDAGNRGGRERDSQKILPGLVRRLGVVGFADSFLAEERL